MCQLPVSWKSMRLCDYCTILTYKIISNITRSTTTTPNFRRRFGHKHRLTHAPPSLTHLTMSSSLKQVEHGNSRWSTFPSLTQQQFLRIIVLRVFSPMPPTNPGELASKQVHSLNTQLTCIHRDIKTVFGNVLIFARQANPTAFVLP